MLSPASPATLLASWLQQRLAPDAWAWLTDRRGRVAGGNVKDLYLSFGLVPRKLGKAQLDLSPAEWSEAQAVRPDWRPTEWSVDQAARVLLVLAYPAAEESQLTPLLDQLFAAGEVGELVALYQALPLFPFPEAHRARCAEGIRTNMRSVFLAIAYGNPYPAEQLDEEAWNHLVLKALFMGLSLDPIVGLDRRRNARLAEILVDYAEERWAAGRPVSPELWRPVGPFATPKLLESIRRVAESGTPLERAALSLALSESTLPAARELQARMHVDEADRSLNWSDIAIRGSRAE